MSLSTDCMKNIKVMLADIKRIIVGDNRIASQTRTSVGVAKKFKKVVPPNIPSSSFSDLQLMGDNDKFTLGKIHERCHKHFFHVDATLRDP